MAAPFRAWAKKDWQTNFFSRWIPSVESKNEFKISTLKGRHGKYYGYLEFTFNNKHLVSVTVTEDELLEMLYKIRQANGCAAEEEYPF